MTELTFSDNASRSFVDDFMRDQWYPAAYARELGEDPVGVEVLGEDIVLFRTADGARAAKDLCVYPGSRLSHGRERNDRLVCPYHG